MVYLIDHLQPVTIGRLMDGEVYALQVDCSAWIASHPQLNKWRVEVTSPGGVVYLPESVTIDERGLLTWIIRQSDTVTAGEGMYQIVACGPEGMQRTSAHPRLTVLDTMPGTATDAPPDPSQPWVNQVLNAADRAEEAARQAEEAARDAVITPDDVKEAVDQYLDKNPVVVAPYVLPTASATVKGGVKVGNGLRMDGEALSAEVNQEDIDKLSEEIENIKSGGETEVTLEIPVGFPDAGSNLGYINASGKLIAGTEMFQHTDPISMKAGDRLDFAVKGYRKDTVILAVLAKVSGSGYVKLIDTDVATLMDYSYTADTDCQVVISYDNRTAYSGTVYATRAVGGEHYGDAAHYVNRSDNVVAIKSRYNAEEDIVVEIALAGGNMLPNPKRIYTVDKYSDAIDASLTPSRYLLNRYTDWFSPHQVRAADNADGDDIATVIFTGGNHMSNNSSSGGTVTAVCTQFDVLCDGALVENGNEKYCNSVVINITNEICGYNTWKADGTGRRILKEQIRITIGLTAKMEVEIIHTALEDVERMRYYGLQCVNDAYTAGIQYLGGANRAFNPIDAASDCGNKTCRDGRLLSNNGDVMLTHMDDVDLGSFAYAPANNASYFATTATKAYFSLISNSGTAETVFAQAAGEQTCCRGWYDFIHVN